MENEQNISSEKLENIPFYLESYHKKLKELEDSLTDKKDTNGKLAEEITKIEEECIEQESIAIGLRKNKAVSEKLIEDENEKLEKVKQDNKNISEMILSLKDKAEQERLKTLNDVHEWGIKISNMIKDLEDWSTYYKPKELEATLEKVSKEILEKKQEYINLDSHSKGLRLEKSELLNNKKLKNEFLMSNEAAYCLDFMNELSADTEINNLKEEIEKLETWISEN